MFGKRRFAIHGSTGNALWVWQPTTRYENIEVEYYDFSWKKQRQKLSEWTAQICQHEIDHLAGIII